MRQKTCVKGISGLNWIVHELKPWYIHESKGCTIIMNITRVRIQFVLDMSILPSKRTISTEYTKGCNFKLCFAQCVANKKKYTKASSFDWIYPSTEADQRINSRCNNRIHSHEAFSFDQEFSFRRSFWTVE